MISKELFCTLLTQRDIEFNRMCSVTRVLEDIFKTGDKKLLDTDALYRSLDLLCEVLAAEFSAPMDIIKCSLGLEDDIYDDFTEMEESLPDGTEVIIHSYSELYDYLLARRDQIEAGNQ